MVRRGELTDEAWGRIAPLLPEGGRRGGRWKDHRTVVNGILWKLRTGAPWRDLPERYGPWQTCYDRFARLAVDHCPGRSTRRSSVVARGWGVTCFKRSPNYVAAYT